MRWAPFFLTVLALVAACVVEDKPVTPPFDGSVDGSVDAGECGFCPVDEPVCVGGTECVQCTAGEQAYCTARDQVCDVENQVCVDCLDDTQCTAPSASRCDLDNNACAECQTAAQCDDVEGLPASDNACDDGVCRECTPETEAETCPDSKSCDPETNTCTDTTVGSLAVCDECIADSECGDEGEPSEAYKCVPMYYPNDQTRFPDEETGFCLKVFSLGGCEQPYAIRINDRPSLSDDQKRSYCGINESLATCPAVRALVENETCPSGEDTECPTSGICRDVGGLSNRCTYLCAIVVECLENVPDGRPGSTCGSSGSGGDDYCGG